jgi:transcriptional regulator with XRE-family HTH domain
MKINLQNLRERKRVPREKLALILGVTVTTVYRWESGTRSPSLEMVEKIASALGYTPADLVSPPPGEAPNA